MKYIVNIKEISTGLYEVEADSCEEAEEAALFAAFSGDVQWESTQIDCSGTVCEGISEEQNI